MALKNRGQKVTDFINFNALTGDFHRLAFSHMLGR
jgi:hypothetical protein